MLRHDLDLFLPGHRDRVRRYRHGLDPFVEFLNSRSCANVVRHARSLSFRGDRRFRHSTIPISMLDWILNKFSALHTLSLQETLLEGSPGFVPRSFARPMEKLRIHHVCFGLGHRNPKTRSLTPFLSLFGSVGLFEMDHIDIFGEEGRIVNQISKHFRPRKLVTKNLRYFLTLFEHSKSLEFLDALSICLDPPMPKMHDFFQKVGPNITSLRLDLDSQTGPLYCPVEGGDWIPVQDGMVVRLSPSCNFHMVISHFAHVVRLRAIRQARRCVDRGLCGPFLLH